MSANPRVAGSQKTKGSAGNSWGPLVPGQLAQEFIAGAEKIHLSFLQAAETGVSDLLQASVSMSFLDSSQTTLSGFLEAAGRGAHLVPLDLAPVPGTAFLAFSPALLFQVLDILLATPADASTGGEDSQKARRPPTGIELYILNDFFKAFAAPLRTAWAPFCSAGFTSVPTADEEADSREKAAGDGLALVLRGSIELTSKSDFYLILPAFLARLADMKSKSTADREAGPELVSENILKCLGSARVRIDAVLTGSSIRIRDLLELTPGQVLTVANREGSVFDCLVNGSRQFTGDLIALESRCGVQIEAFAEAAEGGSRKESADR